jgi:hypothetical protein
MGFFDMRRLDDKLFVLFGVLVLIVFFAAIIDAIVGEEDPCVCSDGMVLTPEEVRGMCDKAQPVIDVE